MIFTGAKRCKHSFEHTLSALIGQIFEGWPNKGRSIKGRPN